MNDITTHGCADIKQDGIAVPEKQFVTFKIADESYGVGVLKVQEIIGMTEIVYVPNSPDFMKGVINLRGSVVPVVDMRKRFHMEERVYDMFTVIIIVEAKGELVGMIVDLVSDVVGLPENAVQDTPHFTSWFPLLTTGVASTGRSTAIACDRASWRFCESAPPTVTSLRTYARN